MPYYVTLYQLTDKGIHDIKAAPQRVEQGIKAAEAAGIKVLGFYLTIGEYDYISIAEAPNDEVALTYNMGLGAQGNVRTTSLKAFSVEEMAKMVEKIP